MRIDILTLFPEMVDNALNESIIGRGREAGLIDIRCHHIRDYSPDKRRRTDDYPYGGGQGMVMQCEPLARCLEDVQEGKKVHTILMSPAGARFDQEKARELLAREHIILVCGHYEGVDRRFVDSCIDEELSIGDFVLTGGELPAMCIADAVCRLVPGVLGDEECFTDESHWAGTLEYPQYSRPAEWHGLEVPEILRSGNHQLVDRWRRKQSLYRTYERRPDMYRKLRFETKQERKLLKEMEEEYGQTLDPQKLDRGK